MIKSLNRRGVALVIVLSFLVLISMLIVAFFTSVKTETVASKTYASGISTKQLADSATSLVMGTIKEATYTGTAASSGTQAWASQPGMIRTYDSNGQPVAYYKLYSSDTLKVTTGLAGYQPDADAPLDWDQSPALYTDLNSPVTVPSSTGSSVVFPIIDPRAQSLVEGFSYASGTINGIVSTGDDAERVPMPVRWLYVLQDGSITAPTGVLNGGTTATWVSGSGAPSATNPIVGRIAYWTDDETCKVNINTAGGDLATSPNADGSVPGSFWDTPKVDYPAERLFATNQPCTNEYQRYPGHPATVSLSTVFSGLQRSDIGAIAPRIVDAGSEGGTVLSASSSASVNGQVLPTITPDYDRLYASVDELMFSASARGQNPGITHDTLEKTRFFLTANSRAPDLNLFGQPRVCIWPLWNESLTAASTPHYTATDKMIAFCCTVGGTASALSGTTTSYYFTRSDCTSPTVDRKITRNSQLNAYLQTLTGKAIPGFGGDFLTKYKADRNQILAEIFDYIRIVNLQDANLDPSNWYAPGGQVVPSQIVTATGTTRGFGRFDTISQAALVFYCTGTTALTVAGSSGLPATTTYPTTAMRAVLLFEPYNIAAGYAAPSKPTYQYVVSPQSVNLTTYIDSVDPTKGTGTSSSFHGDTNYVFLNSGYNSRPWGGVGGIANQFMQLSGTTKSADISGAGFGSASCTGSTVYPYITPEFQLAAKNQVFQLMPTTYTVTIKAYNQPIQTITLSFPGAYLPAPVVPAMHSVPGMSWLDTIAMDPTSRFASVSSTNWHNIITTVGSGDGNGATVSGTFTTAGDVVRAIQVGGPTNGDLRLVQAAATVPFTWFSPDYGYDPSVSYVDLNAAANGTSASTSNLTQPGRYQAHSLTAGLSSQRYYPMSSNITNTSDGWIVYKNNLVNAVTQYYPPSVPAFKQVQLFAGKDAVPMSNGKPGDWDTGIGYGADGPHINKTDDGTNAVFTGTYGTGIGRDNIPYYVYQTGTSLGSSLSSPNRQIASAVQFGSLSTGVARGLPWQTLLFRPDPTKVHPGSAAPKDYLLLDLFTMPVVEPYAISEPLSTAGRVNMNYRIAPFKYITRSTAVRAALKATMVMAISPGTIGYYKNNSGGKGNNGNTPGTPFRYPVNPDDTLKFFEDRFNLSDANDINKHGLYVSAGEICDVPLVPKGSTSTKANYAGLLAASPSNFWDDFMLTGDNIRETPYAHLYPLLTTKSNTYTVHIRVQSLKKVNSTPATQWVEGKDQVVGEYRGSTLFERYIDPQDARLDPKSGRTTYVFPDTTSLEQLYRYRVLNTKKFAP